ncbi:DNA alkylation repair protein [Maribacter sp. HTCC2170]|uniref:DNA alkylation repair protein n=1 Tax=Maribacter sp. (strain HTCC2170 / KCCM 42371) TaxID=313603 RepID=UPI00032503BA|nr:DNA alkylation repair protein [Maribacter sp. HTCC2170]
MNEYIQTLELELKRNSNAKIAEEQKAYMRNQFEFYGIKTPVRREIQKPFLAKDFLPPKSELQLIIKTLWNKPEREYQFIGQELVHKYKKQFVKSDIALLEFMVTHKSWWDTVDYIAVKLIGPYFDMFPEQLKPIIEKWLASGNMWLQRCCLLYQLKSKDKMDTQRLSQIINLLLGSNEFFINKAIGWVLREYSRTNPKWVVKFVSNHKLAPLSKREALRLL